MAKWLLLFYLLTIIACKEIEEPPEVVRPVRYQPVYSTGGNRVRSFSGIAKAGKESKLSFKVSGTLSSLNVEVGQTVRKGDKIASLDTKDFSLQSQDAKAALKQSQAQAVNASANYERTRELYENNNTSLSDLESSLAAKKSAEAMVESMRKKVELAQLKLSYTRLSAPFKGQVAALYSEVNENVQGGSPIVLLISQEEQEVRVGIPEVLITKVIKGDTVKIKFHSIPDKKYSGIINEVGISPSQYSSTYPVTIRLEKTLEEVKSGMVADVIFQFSSANNKEKIYIPPFSLLEDKDGRYVFVARPMDSLYATVEKIKVETGELTSNGIEVISGLKEKDYLITAGVSQLNEGVKVKLVKTRE